MGRAILSVIVGYVVMFLVVFVGLTGAYLLLGQERAFKPGVYDVTVMWIIISAVIGLFAAIAGGWVSARIARTQRPPKVLALIVLILGALMAIPTLIEPAADAPSVRAGNVTNMEAMMHARTPASSAFLNAVIGCVGVLIGASAVRRPSSPGVDFTPAA